MGGNQTFRRALARFIVRRPRDLDGERASLRAAADRLLEGAPLPVGSTGET
ncbi:hypothetical protein ACPYPG_08790 [Streptomyces sp. FR-108]|uniref:hypothetical protein n=1 Tax=Streptomyces sp. FR-108 TaxID=3416665 RepID=UPI003CE813BD